MALDTNPSVDGTCPRYRDCISTQRLSSLFRVFLKTMRGAHETVRIRLMLRTSLPEKFDVVVVSTEAGTGACREVQDRVRHGACAWFPYAVRHLSILRCMHASSSACMHPLVRPSTPLCPLQVRSICSQHGAHADVARVFLEQPGVQHALVLLVFKYSRFAGIHALCAQSADRT